MAVIYEVELEVDRAIESPYLAWLDAHVAEILSLPGFTGARRFERLEPAPAEGRFALVVHYVLRDREALDAYLDEHAPRLRGDGMVRFGGRFEARRRVLLDSD